MEKVGSKDGDYDKAGILSDLFSCFYIRYLIACGPPSNSSQGKAFPLSLSATLTHYYSRQVGEFSKHYGVGRE